MKIIISIICLFITMPCFAEDFYIAQTAAGGETGSDCANALAVTFFNTVGNWGAGAGKISDGDTVYGCGTITTTLNPPASGTTGITFKATAGFKLSKSAWGTTTGAAIYINGRSYLTFDGDGVGVIENTDNGTNLGTQQDSNAVYINGGSYLTIKGWTMQNIYVRVPVAEPSASDANAYGRIISVMDSPHLDISGNTLTHGKYGILVQASIGNPDVLLIYNNNVSKCSTSIVAALSGATNYTGIEIHNNTLSDWTPWAGCWTSCTAWNHNDGIHLWGSYSENTLSAKIYNNLAGGDITSHMTGLFFSEGAAKDLLIYSNIFYANTGLRPTDGFIVPAPDYAGATIQVYNNTIVGSASTNLGGNGIYSSGSTSSGTTTTENNIIKDVYIGIWVDNGTTLTSDYNNIYSVGAVGRDTAFRYTLADWQARGHDAHSAATNPILDASYVPGAPITGVDQSALFTTDYYGNTWTSWRAGAVYSAGVSPVNGVCGAADGAYLAAAPTTTRCSAGTPSTVTGTYSWYCDGTDGGSRANCLAGVVSVSANKAAGRYATTQTVTLTGNADHFLYYYGNSATGTPATTYTAPIATILMNYDGTPKYLRIQAVDGVGGTGAITTIGPLKKQRKK